MAKKQKMNKKYLVACFGLLLIIGFGLGFMTKALWPKDYSPENVVIVADDTIKAPKDLLSFLEKETKDDCNNYKGTDTQRGVPLTSVYEVVQEKYARAAIGCSTNLDMGSPVIKTNDGWKLFSGAAYYVYANDDIADDSPMAYARCSIVDKYEISKEFESSCLEDEGKDSQSLTESDIRAVEY